MSRFWNRLKSPAPEANEDLAKEKFYSEMAKAKNAPALGVKMRLLANNFQSQPDLIKVGVHHHYYLIVCLVYVVSMHMLN